MKPVIHALQFDDVQKPKDDFLQRARTAMVQRTLEILDHLCIEPGWLLEAKDVIGNEVSVPRLENHVRATGTAYLEGDGSDEEQRITHGNLGDYGSEYDLTSRMTLVTRFRPNPVSAPAARENPQVRQMTHPNASESSLEVVPSASTPVRRNSRNGHNQAGGPKRRNMGEPKAGQNSASEPIDVQRQRPNNSGQNAKDRKVHRRMLTALLSHIRAITNAILITYSVLVHLEEDIQNAFDANGEGNEYDLFSFLTLVRTAKASIWRREYLHLVESKKLRGKSLITKTVVTSQFAIHLTDHSQDSALSALLASGVVDEHEFNIIDAELVQVRRRHVNSHFFLRLRPGTLPNPKSLSVLREHPLFAVLNSSLLSHVLDQHGVIVDLQAGEEQQVEEGSLVLVLQGAIQPTEDSFDVIQSDKQQHCSSASVLNTKNPVDVQGLKRFVEEYHPQEAVDLYRKAIDSQEQQNVDPEIWNNLSSLLARLGRVDEAIEVAKNIDSTIRTENHAIAYNQGRLQEIARNYDAAEEIYKKFRKDDAHYNEVIIRLGVISMSKPEGYEKAEANFLEAMNDRYTRPIAVAYLSALYLKQGEKDHGMYKKAQDLLEKHRHDCDYLALAFAGFMHRFLNDLLPERRIRFLINHIGGPLITLLKRNPRNASAANGAGVYFTESNTLGDARDAFQAAVSGPNPEKMARVNLAHTHVMLGNREIRESIRQNGRPSARALTNARSLYEQANKLYSDALESTSKSESPEALQSHSELLLYSAWALFEARQFRASAEKLQKLVKLRPSSAAAWFNLGFALLEAATERATISASRLGELELAKTEFEESRSALQNAMRYATPHREQLSQTRVSRSNTQNLERIRAEDREREFQAKAALVEDMKRKEEERKRAEEDLKRKKEEELVKAFNESLEKQRRFMQEEEERRRREKEDDEEEPLSGEENGESKRKTKRKRRRRESENGDEGKRKGSSKKGRTISKVSGGTDSSSEYSDVDAENADAGREIESDKENDDKEETGEKARAGKRRKVSLSDEEDEVGDE
ncbi:RNA polymerase-associated protein Ctr9 [Gracilaria domingensis]|nr:RNA polymerase-associated protein Ctr9 [Gracilaria domingensis]